MMELKNSKREGWGEGAAPPPQGVEDPNVAPLCLLVVVVVVVVVVLP